MREAFYHINEIHRKLGVHWWMTDKPQLLPCMKAVTFWGFHRHKAGFNDYRAPDRRYKGLGAACMRDIISLADDLKITIYLWCRVPKLFPYYESFGFVHYANDYNNRKYRRRPRG